MSNVSEGLFKELEFLMLRVGINESNEEKVSRFMNGLWRNIQGLVELYEYCTIENLFHLVLKIITQLKGKDGTRRSYSHYNVPFN